MTGTYAAFASAESQPPIRMFYRFAAELPGKVAAIVLNSPNRDDPAS